jgi:hypothetical protein
MGQVSPHGAERARQSARPSLDVRTRRLDDVVPVSVAQLVDEVGPDLAARHGDLSARAQERLGLPPLTLRVGPDACTVDGGTVRPGVDPDGAVLEVEPAALTDLIAGVRSTYALVFAGGGRLAGGSTSAVLGWDQVLQAFTDGRPLHVPGRLGFVARTGRELDLKQVFGPDDDDDDIAHFVAQAGFCRLRGWVDPSLLPRIAGEVTQAARHSERDDPNRWWATLEDGTERCIRLMYLLESSASMAALVDGPVYTRLGGLFPDGHSIHRENPQASEALIKPLRVASGLTEFPWHRDCSMGGHAYHCAAYAIGLPLGATGGDAGYLRVVAGSHRVSTPPPGAVEGFDPALPVLAVETAPGDLTIHLGCTLHGTRPPRSAERIVTYTTFSLPPREPGDRRLERRPELQDTALSATRRGAAASAASSDPGG